MNQYVSIFSPGVIPIRGKADADARVAVTTTVGGVSTTYLPDRSGQDFSLDIPVDNSSGAVTAAVQVDALKHDGTLDVDLHRRLSGDYTVPAATPQVPTYDADGNLLTYDGWTYAWNAQDRLVSATKGDTRLEFNYDYLGRRFEKKVYENNTQTRHQLFVYDGFKQIAEYDALDSNALANTYLWQPVGLDVPLLRNGGEFFVSDANKNIVALIDTTGQVTDTYLYDPFGKCTHSGSSTNPFRFSSEYFDEETGLVYYNYRYYASGLGRWTTRDLIEEERGTNLFELCFNNTLNLYDMLGLHDNQCNFCGADTTQRLTDELNAAMSNWYQSYGGKLSTDVFQYAYHRLLTRWNEMRKIGPDLDYTVEIHIDYDKMIQCPSGQECERTYTVCGECVHDHFIGNIMYGFWMKLFDYSEKSTYLFGHIYQFLGKSDDGTYKGAFRKDYPYDQAGYELGFALFNSHISAFSTESVCQVIKKLDAFRRANETGKDYSHCQKCPIP